MPQHVVVKEYDIAWESEFKAEAARLKSVLGGNCAHIHHIGSTSVPGLAAKPIIDIMPVLYDLSAADGLAAEFERLGYEYLGEFGIPGRRYMRKGGDERTHQVHMFCISDSYNIYRHLAFRDYLRAHPDVRDAYAALKKELAEKYPYDIEAYCDGKARFVESVQSKALSDL